jgi:hypothetical protein
MLFLLLHSFCGEGVSNRRLYLIVLSYAGAIEAVDKVHRAKNLSIHCTQSPSSFQITLDVHTSKKLKG